MFFKKIFFIIAFLIFSVVSFLPSAGMAQELEPFVVIFLGTKHFSEVDLLAKNIKKISSVKKFVQSVSSQNHIQYAGAFSGDGESLVADIEGLSADSFSVQSKDDKTRGLVITLKKIKD